MTDRYDIELLQNWLKLAKTEGTDAIKIVVGDELDTYKVTIIREGQKGKESEGIEEAP